MQPNRHWFYRTVEDSFKADRRQREEEASVKEPALRGGNAGAVHQGVWYGSCPRITALRYEGIETPVDNPKNTYRQFAGGFANEDIIYEQLVKGGIPAELIKREEEIPVVWETEGVKVTGRPDIAVMNTDGTVKTLFELKTVVSIWSAIGVHYDLKPKSDHLIQAAHYAMHHDPEELLLVYSNRAQFHLSTAPGWMRKKFQPGVYDVDFKADGTPMKILSFDRVYQLTWREDGYLEYWTEGMDKPQATTLSKEGIRAYYSQVARSLQAQEQLPRPSKLSVDGSKSYLKCQYCPLATVCDQYENEYTTWKDHVVNEVATLKKELEDE